LFLQTEGESTDCGFLGNHLQSMSNVDRKKKKKGVLKKKGEKTVDLVFSTMCYEQLEQLCYQKALFK